MVLRTYIHIVPNLNRVGGEGLTKVHGIVTEFFQIRSTTWQHEFTPSFFLLVPFKIMINEQVCIF